MSGYFNCPWCDYEMNGYDMFECEDVYHVACQSCHKPIVANVEVVLTVDVDEDKSAIEAERIKYEKRMRGDWS